VAIGNNPQLLAIHLVHHILLINSYFDQLYRLAEDNDSQIDICQPTLTHVLSFLGWLQACETFGIIKWQDINIIDPRLAPAWDY
jgi:hypothetical protein